MAALQEIQHYQKSTELLLKKAPFTRIVKEITQDNKHGVKWRADAVMALQEMAEFHLVNWFNSKYSIFT